MIDKIFTFWNRHTMRPFDKQLDRKKSLIGVEIGVNRGAHAKTLLRKLNIDILYLIDPYENNILLQMHGRAKLAKFTDKIIWGYLKSEDAIDSIPSGLDFVYIDGNHNYEYVKKDIELYYPKIRKGGIIGGHDYDQVSVARAIIEFAVKHNLIVNISHGHIIDWWMIKNG